jgi:glycerophosphoryl diester phosphodiesterase
MRGSIFLATTALLATLATSKLSNAAYFYNRTRPFVIAHRGASGQFPEHSVGSYSSAYYYGADYVEIDL